MNDALCFFNKAGGLKKETEITSNKGLLLFIYINIDVD